MLIFVIAGYTSKQIARELNLSHRTVEAYVENLKRKFVVKRKNQIMPIIMMRSM